MSQNYSLEPMAGSLLNMALKDRPLRVKTKSKLDDACEPPEEVGGGGKGEIASSVLIAMLRVFSETKFVTSYHSSINGNSCNEMHVIC